MKTSLVITIFNEEKTIKRLLDSLVNQTKKPDEIIFIDGGSSDRTVAEIENSRLRQGFGGQVKLKIFVKTGATIAVGRNFGIREAENEIVVMTDAGCVLHKDWFEKITEPFKDKEIDVVAGFYQMTGESVFQKCLPCYLGILPERLDPRNFMPSARSIAFRKKIWEEIGGFNEKLERAGEDTLFNYQAKQLGARFLTVSNALVDWEMPKTWQEAIKKFYIYAKGDGQAGTHSLKISAIYFRYILGLVTFFFGFYLPIFWIILTVGFIAYLLWAVGKNYNLIQARQAFFILPALQVVSDIAVMAGFLIGRFKRVDEN